ncbi:Acetyl-CoA acetyltransferase OS=Tsukamurella paurometabola (strain ATCC 8368 / DSM / CCUG 35730/ CIP 100753 / JCM 10117 / KCTC 9821 / NBRC 16120 / NCIMB 702349 / NCTC 13040) OX=521096 GN=Tpau_3832 PE=3 SV=1 [Tsukamurella paurometabola]|uniref:Acetyl-CoA acetyltransferase n=1 Tax=Tsukamurella paurometabola (strain ATCC 8368 / DSM 20162 / CCUG 35730 / CIP 100753 / JCM 10117 / KCTC 9821 / NBRC 16120 / NCIMB 702349 / NCTC 13040) TaxID=521096 RepID=D5UYV4_TSUPD|nr:acetyl-CoA C-acetyltransferase [Tsukamurella paurometabola]ADG80407.1 acetyl-CoA acetyltransferase [Tsukamurella paurometabola DSM 20162]SUP39520.1 3-ketoacyl-CoA thiolase [Tsukamurella paurometabola]
MTATPDGAYILDAVRTPTGKRGGSLADVHSADLGAHVLRATIERSGVDPALIDDVIMGCCDTIGPQSGNIARTAWLAAGLPEHVPGVTVDRQCGSSQQSVHFATQAVLSGTADAVVAAGVQNMSAIPISAAMLAGKDYGFDDPFSGSIGWRERYGDVEVSQFTSADMIATKCGISRRRMEEFALDSHERAIDAIDGGRFAAEIAPVGGFAVDETPRRGTSLEKMESLPPLAEGSSITAAVASQIADGAAALVVASGRFVDAHGLRPRARVHHISVRAADPVWMLTGPIPATKYALEKTGLSVGDIDLFECNEAFASIPLAWMDELGIAHEKVNVNGGGIALGHPLGATGAKLMTTLVHELERRDGRYALQTMCEGGGTANVTIIERL